MGKYDDILYMKHPEPKTRPRMALCDRAPQFAPFAALVGFEDTLEEATRVTQDRIELSEDDAAIVDRRLRQIRADSQVTITFFVPDPRKTGGTYITHQGMVHRLDPANRRIEFCDGMCICLDDIIGVQLSD